MRSRSATLFPCTTLFRSRWWWRRRCHERKHVRNLREFRSGVEKRNGGDSSDCQHMGGDRKEQRNRVPVRHPAMLAARSEEHTSELQSQSNLVCRLLLEKE